jgi:hypothetical protein
VPVENIQRRDLLKRLLKGVPVAAAGAITLLPRRESPSTVVSIPGLQQAFRQLGYLPASHETGILDKDTERALLRFKRHARRSYRISAVTGLPDDVPPHSCFTGECDLDLGEPTIREILQWLGRGWKLPLGRFKLESLAAGDVHAPRALRWSMLRSDVALEWRKAMRHVEQLGGTLEGPYGDTWRPLGFHHKDGASPRSFHITGRAIDLNQQLAHGRKQRYFIVADQREGREYWRIFCRTARQDGSQGRQIRQGAYSCWQFLAVSSAPIPGGYYLDLTEVLGEHGFERIPARPGWESNYLRTEWWHYHYAPGKQETFLDECELVGISEGDLLRAGYSHEDMDRRPG